MILFWITGIFLSQCRDLMALAFTWAMALLTTRVIQWYEYTGVLGGSLWVLVLNILLFNLIKGYLQGQPSGRLRHNLY
jgi:apolipoprotein N-acyltransferase